MSTEGTHESKDVLITNILTNYNKSLRYIKSKYLIIALCGLLGGLLFYGYASIKEPVFTALCTLVVEDTKNSQLSQYSDVASIAEYNMSGVTGNGIFADDNIVELYKSKTMIKKTLFSEIDVQGVKQLLINRYMDVLKLRPKWEKIKGVGHIHFSNIPGSSNRKQDSLMLEIITSINKTVLSVTKPDKKLTIINVEVKFTDEIFAKEFNDKLVKNVSDFYVNTKTRRSLENLTILQKQVDSVRNIIKYSIRGVATAIDDVPNANPTRIKLSIPSQNGQVDVQANTSIYVEMIKNLELAKIALRHEMPLIQIIDYPMIPLEVHKLGKIRSLLTGAIVGALISAIILLVNKHIKNLIKSSAL